MRIDIWSDIACPWCYIGLIRFEEALAAFPHKDAVEVHYRTFQLDPTLPERDDRSEAQYLSETKGMPANQIHQMFETVKAHGKEAGVEFNMDDVVVANSWTAHRLLHLAKQHDQNVTDHDQMMTPALKRELLAGHFGTGLDLSDHDQLAQVAVSVGLDEDRVREVLASDEFDTEAQADVNQARAFGVSAVPTYVLAEKYALPGAQSVETFSQALQQVWDELNPAPLQTLGAEGQTCGVDGCD
ncbi:DsbA family oxidoreductase [Enteractinococcus coprophilus]|uniref:Putative DsbA family dithiol-disulfide isomerase n=1 Tax=Enteractinococcus coprophilus TaxID=1027633 RepID=A0A543AG01_9MICC|nr:DsbA family oxidoreductase [Enteractinococcus coprophilus]TQL71509.1 putative DsbA family dithiol-disulfide isomerase [Enteractinococcus coprophilus]